MRLNCPHCRQPIELVPSQVAADTSGDARTGSSEATCPLCGSHLPVMGSTLTFVGVVRQKLGQFELQEQLGQGQFGVVWKAWDTELDRTVALKIPRTAEIFEKGEELFRKEARSIAALDHPNIVRLFDVKHEASQLVIVTEYVPGMTLQQRMKANPYSFHDAAGICQQLGEALHHAHERGIVHRDIKPSNVLINHEGIPKLADFGLAKRDAAEITMTLDGQILGTPAYMPPEQAKGHSHSADRRSDVYSLGVILYEMLTGRRPFQGSTRLLLEQVISSDPRTPRGLVKSIPRDLETICLTAMAKDPARRYQTAADFAADLQRFRNGDSIVARPAGVWERMWKWSRRRPWQIATCVLAGIALMIGTAWGTSPKLLPTPVEVRSVMIDTKPDKARLVFYPRDPQTGEPLPESAIRPAARSKLTLDLPVGDYLVVAVLDDGRFHEVYRRVPGKSVGMGNAYLHQTWEVKDGGQIELPEIKIPEADVARNMAKFEGSSQFQMGIKDDSFVPVHDRFIPPYLLDPHEVTVAEFRALKKRLPATWDQAAVVPDENVAVTRLFFDEAVAYAEKAGKRLMTEAEYEFAATRGGTAIYPWGNTAPPAAWPIGSANTPGPDKLATNPAVLGLFSNVGEWTSSLPLPYPEHLKLRFDISQLMAGSRIVRGAPPHIAVSGVAPANTPFTPRHRLSLGTMSLPKNVGFRLARSLRPRMAAAGFEKILANAELPPK